jgi:enediyne biosynthesis protein E4
VKALLLTILIASGRAQSPLFVEVPAAKSKIVFVHENGRSPSRYLPETLGPGVAFLDYNNDGWMDIYIVNSGPADFFTPKKLLRNALYRNNGNGTFTDVTLKARVAGRGFGMGVAAADFDNDGYTDLLVTAYGSPILYHNNGDGTFTDITERALKSPPAWTTCAVWFDADNDSLLDLFLCSFVRYSRSEHVPCGLEKTGKSSYCIPTMFKPQPSVLYRNLGGGSFERVEAFAGSPGKALGAVATDVNNDRRLDLFVANDTVQNFLFLNRGGNRFQEIALQAEVAFSMDGKARSGMGVDAVDFDEDGHQDLFVANIDRELFSLYRNTGAGVFADVALSHDIGRATMKLSGWGLRFFDFDNDGSLDLFLANGHPDDFVEQRTAGVTFREPLLLFANTKGRLRDISGGAGPVFGKTFAARGLATGDFNNDGRVDVLIGVNGGAPLLLENRAEPRNHWVGVQLRSTTANRDAVGAVIRYSAGGVIHRRFRRGGGSYMSSHDPREVLGLGKGTVLDWVEVEWPAPSQRRDRFVNLAIDRYHVLIEGQGKLAP